VSSLSRARGDCAFSGRVPGASEVRLLRMLGEAMVVVLLTATERTWAYDELLAETHARGSDIDIADVISVGRAMVVAGLAERVATGRLRGRRVDWTGARPTDQAP
jgi:hypothetical protein